LYGAKILNFSIVTCKKSNFLLSVHCAMFFQDSLLLSPVFWLAWSFLVLAFVTYWYNVIGKSVSTILNVGALTLVINSKGFKKMH
jgi:hypothetical protein